MIAFLVWFLGTTGLAAWLTLRKGQAEPPIHNASEGEVRSA